MSEWQDIKTAPKDGRFIDAYNANWGTRFVVCWSDKTEVWDNRTGERIPSPARWQTPISFFDIPSHMVFTHWKPLPPPEPNT